MKHATPIEPPATPKSPVAPVNEVTQFARRHKISIAVAKAILLNAHSIKDADRAVVKMRG